MRPVWLASGRRPPAAARTPYRCAIFKLLLIALLAAGAYFGYENFVAKVDPDEIPVPSHVVVTPPPVTMNVPNPLR